MFFSTMTHAVAVVAHHIISYVRCWLSNRKGIQPVKRLFLLLQRFFKRLLLVLGNQA